MSRTEIRAMRKELAIRRARTILEETRHNLLSEYNQVMTHLQLGGEDSSHDTMTDHQGTVEVYVIDRVTNLRPWEYPDPIVVYANALREGQTRAMRVGYRSFINLRTNKLVPVEDMPEPPPCEPNPDLDHKQPATGHIIIGPKDKKMNLRCNFHDIIGLHGDKAVAVLQKENFTVRKYKLIHDGKSRNTYYGVDETFQHIALECNENDIVTNVREVVNHKPMKLFRNNDGVHWVKRGNTPPPIDYDCSELPEEVIQSCKEQNADTVVENLTQRYPKKEINKCGDGLPQTADVKLWRVRVFCKDDNLVTRVQRG